MEKGNEVVIKIIVIGNSSVGKSSFVYYLINGKGTQRLNNRKCESAVHDRSGIHIKNDQNRYLRIPSSSHGIRALTLR
jgi:GTPase SAR1 family protein